MESRTTHTHSPYKYMDRETKRETEQTVLSDPLSLSLSDFSDCPCKDGANKQTLIDRNKPFPLSSMAAWFYQEFSFFCFVVCGPGYPHMKKAHQRIFNERHMSCPLCLSDPENENQSSSS